MKWIALTPVIFLLTACGCYTNTTEYQQVNVAPIVATPVYYDSAVIIDNEPIDVTTTAVEYY